jgi:hypothetical protein
VDEYQRVGMNLPAALEEVRQYASGLSEDAPDDVSEEAIARQNQASFAELENLMRGVK